MIYTFLLNTRTHTDTIQHTYQGNFTRELSKLNASQIHETSWDHLRRPSEVKLRGSFGACNMATKIPAMGMAADSKL